MSLLGALFSGVAGLNSQSNKIGIISDNISNVNTVGYKGGAAAFSSLVVPSGSTTQYAPGGSSSTTRQLVDKQGLIQGSDSPTDIAISGNGMFVINTDPAGTGRVLYTRAGSFRQDSLGNFINTSGFFLQGWPLDANGALPSNSASVTSLKTVNVKNNTSGTASSTTKITLAANLNAGQAVLLGAGETVDIDANSVNSGITANQIMIGDDYNGAATPTGIIRGDGFTILRGLATGPDTFTYGGYGVSRSVINTSTLGDAGNTLFTQSVISAMSATNAGTSKTGYGITGINVVSASADAVTNGPFANAVINVGGTTTAAIGATATLTQIASAIQTALQARATDSGSTAVVSGNSGNYSITVVDKLAQTGFTANAALAGSTGFDLVSSVAYPAATHITIDVGTAANSDKYTIGDTIDIAGASAVGAIGATNINGTRTIVAIDRAAHTIVFASGGTATGVTAGAGGTASVTTRTQAFSGNILDASTTSDLFLKNSNVSSFTSQGLTFSVTSAGTTTTFKYVGTAPDTTKGEFNNMTTLVTAINGTTGLTSRVDQGRLYVSSADANNDLVFANGDAAGSASLDGIDWVQEFDFRDVASATTGVQRFSSQQDLANKINATASLTATVNNPLGSSTVSINNSDPSDTIQFTDVSGNTGSLLREFGFPALTLVTGNEYDTGTLASRYVATDPLKNMAGGNITPQFTRNINVFDSLGNSHTVAMSFVKLQQVSNTWSLEVYSVPADDVISTNNDGQITQGLVSFNGDGTLKSIANTLSSVSGVSVQWNPLKSAADPSHINLNLGSVGKSNGLAQFSAPFNVSLADQNGSSVGDLVGVTIDDSGFVIASFSNGQTQKVFQLPVADVFNPNGMQEISGNAFAQTNSSGVANLRQAGTNGVGKVATSSLEGSNVDLAAELTELIVAQRAYQANTRVLSITSDLLDKLNQI